MKHTSIFTLAAAFAIGTKTIATTRNDYPGQQVISDGGRDRMLLDLIIRRRFHRRRLRHDKPSPLTKVHENRTLVPRPTSAEPLNPVARHYLD